MTLPGAPPLRVALMGPSWPLRGGIAKTTTQLALALEARGALAAFFTPARQYPPLLYPGGSDTDPDVCPRVAAAERCYSVMEPWTWLPLLRGLRSARYDALIFPYWTWAWAPLLRAAQAASPAPAIAIAHNAADHDAHAPARVAARLSLSACRAFFCHAEGVADALRQRHEGREVAVYPEPPSPERPADRDAARGALGLSPGDVAVLFFGLLRPYKGVDVLLDAAARLPPESPVKIVIAGEPWAEIAAEIEARLSRPEAAGRILAHLRWIPEEEAPAFFAAADALALPYRAATGSGVAARGMASGLPVIASRVGGLAEVVEPEVSGILVPPGDVGALTDALSRITDAALRARLGAGAKRRMQGLSWGAYADALLDLAGRAAAAGEGR